MVQDGLEGVRAGAHEDVPEGSVPRGHVGGQQVPLHLGTRQLCYMGSVTGGLCYRWALLQVGSVTWALLQVGSVTGGLCYMGSFSRLCPKPLAFVQSHKQLK